MPGPPGLRRRWLGSLARGAGADGGAGSGRGGTPGHLAGVSATRAGIRLRRRVRTEQGATRREAPGSWAAGSWSLDAWAPGWCSAHRSPLLRVAPARVASQGQQPKLRADEEVGEGGWPGDWGRPGGPGLGPPQPPPLAAGETRSGCDRRGRKLSDLRGKTSKQTAVRRRCPPASALAPLNPPQPNPATGHDLGRPLCGRAQGIGSPDAATGPPSLGPAASAYLASASRHSDSD